MSYIHCGYELKMDEIDEKAVEILKNYVLKDVVRNKKDGPVQEQIKLERRPYTAMYFRAKGMDKWFHNKKHKTTYAYLHYLFVDPKKHIIVSQGTIDGIHVYITLTQKSHGYKPIELKKMANSGKLGTHFTIDTIKVPTRPYISWGEGISI